MHGKQIYLTRDGYERMRKEFEFVRTTRRVELSKAIGEAIAQGDISENAEYDAAKDAQALNEIRIVELEGKLSQVKIIDDMKIPSDKVYIGAKVGLKNVETGEEFERILLSGEEADPGNGKISISSPVGQGLLGNKEGDVIEINVPDGTLKYEILSISRDHLKVKC